MDQDDNLQRLQKMEVIQSEIENEHTEFMSELSTLIVSVVEAVPDAIIVVNGEGSVVLANRQAELLFDYHRRDLINQKVEMLVPERLRQKHVGHRSAFSLEPRTRLMGSVGEDPEGGEVRLNLLGRRRNGHEFEVRIMLAPLVTTKGTHILAVVRRK